MNILPSEEVTAKEYLYNNLNLDKIYVSKLPGEDENTALESVVSYNPSDLLIQAANALRLNENPVLKETNDLFFFSELNLESQKETVIGEDICAVVKDKECLDYMRMYLIMLTDSERDILDEMLGACLEENMIGYGTPNDFAIAIIGNNN